MTATENTPTARLLAAVERAEALAEQATPGPWEVEKGSDLEGTPFCHIEGWTTSDHTDWLCLDPDDARFIAASRTLVPQMAAALRVCIGALERIESGGDYDLLARDSMKLIANTALARAAAAMEGGDE